MPKFIVTTLVIALLWSHKSIGYYELVEELGCHDTEFRLTCGKLDTKIAIIEAIFSHNDTAFKPLRASCGNDSHVFEEQHWKIYERNDTHNLYNQLMISGLSEVNFRHAINKRCSGVSYCSFILREDYTPSIKWGSGSVYLRYICMDDTHITKSCTADLDVNYEGFVQSPGYPRFYLGDRTCRWTLRARPSQTVRVNFLDISLRRAAPLRNDCKDFLTVTEDGFNKLTACGDTIGNIQVQSSGHVLNISLVTTSKLLFPKRGILFHYKAVGCLPPRTPHNGDLIYNNKSVTQYRCCPGYVFPDTLSIDRVLRCYGENTWDMDVPDCVLSRPLKAFDSAILLSSINYQKINFTAEKAAVMDEQNNVKDVIVPSIIMAIIFIGNALILLVILHYRKKLDLSHCRKRSKTNEENEMKNLGLDQLTHEQLQSEQFAPHQFGSNK